MKTSFLNFSNLPTLIILIVSVFAWSCDEDEPEREDTPELVTKVTLTFTPSAGGSPVVVTATDPDNIGPQDIVADAPIALKLNTTYLLSISLINELAEPLDDDYDIANEVLQEADEHLFYFSWTGNSFSSPAGNGNIDNRSDPVRYEDEDVNGLPLGLSTTWTTASQVISAQTFRLVLKHQPDLKTSTSTAQEGETDVDLEFDLEIIE